MAIERLRGIERAAGIDEDFIPTSTDEEIPDKLPVVRMYVNPQNGRLVVDYEDGQ